MNGMHKAVLLAAALTALGAGPSFGWTRYTGDAEKGGRFSDPNTWQEKKVPQTTDAELQFWFQPMKDGITYVNDLSYPLNVRQLLFPLSPEMKAKGVSTIRLAGNALNLGDADYSGSALQVEQQDAVGGQTVEIFNDLVATREQTCIDVSANATLALHGDLKLALSGENTSKYSFRFVGAGTKVIKGSSCQPDGVSWTAGMSFANGTTRLEGDLALPGFDLGSGDGYKPKLEIAPGGRVRIVTCTTGVGQIRNGAELDICGGILDQRISTTQPFYFSTGTLRIRNGGILRTSNSYRHGYNGLSETIVETGGVWSCSSAHYMEGSRGGGAIHLTVRGGTVFAETTYGFNLGYRASDGATSNTNWIHLAAGGEFRTGKLNQGFRYGESALDKDVYLYADGGTLVYSPTGDDIYSGACDAFINGTASRFHTVVREGGFIFNNLSANVTYNGPIEGNDNGGADGGLVKLGGATLTLTGVGTYTGTNDVRRGTLKIAAANAATMTTVSSVGELELPDPAHYANGVSLALGAVLNLSGTGAYTLSTLSAGPDAVIVLSPSTASLAVASAIEQDGNLDFRLSDSAVGSYAILTAPNAADIVSRCRVLEPKKDTDYTFTCAGNTITLTIAAKAKSSAWNLAGAGNWNVAENWSADVPNAAGAQAVFGTALKATSTLTVDTAATVGGLFVDGAASQYTLSNNNKLQFAADDAALAYIGGTMSAHFYVSTPLVTEGSIEVEESSAYRIYLESVSRTFGGNDPTMRVRIAGKGYVYISGGVAVPTVVEQTGTDFAHLMTRDGSLNRFQNGLYMRNGVIFGHYGSGATHKVCGDFRMTEGGSFDAVYDGSTYVFEHPIGTLWLRNDSSAPSTGTLIQNFRAESLADVDSIMMYHATLAYAGAADAVLPRTSAQVRGRGSKPGINTIARQPDAGDLTVDGGNVFYAPQRVNGEQENHLHFAGDMTGRIVLRNGFIDPEGGKAVFGLDSGKFLLKDSFVYSRAVGSANEVTIGSDGKETSVVFEDGALLQTENGRTLGDTTLDLSAGGTIKADAFAFAGTLKVKASDDPYGAGQVSVGTATFAPNGTIDFGGTSGQPLAKRRNLRVLKFKTLSAEDEANLRTWTVTGSGRDDVEPVLEIDRAAGLVTAGFKKIGLTLIFR